MLLTITIAWLAFDLGFICGIAWIRGWRPR